MHFEAAREDLVGSLVGPLTKPMARKLRTHTQRWFVIQLQSMDGYNLTEWLRTRRHRWRLPGFPGRNALLVAAQLARLRKMVPPRLRAATLSTILNRWTTDRRMRHVRKGACTCLLHCRDEAADSIEHYFRCPVWLDWQRRRLGDRLVGHGLGHGVLASRMSDEALRLQAVATYLLYRTVNHLRHHRFAQPEERQQYIQHYLNQMLHEATRDDSALRRCCGCPVADAARKRAREQEPE